MQIVTAVRTKTSAECTSVEAQRWLSSTNCFGTLPTFLSSSVQLLPQLSDEIIELLIRHVSNLLIIHAESFVEGSEGNNDEKGWITLEAEMTAAKLQR